MKRCLPLMITAVFLSVLSFADSGLPEPEKTRPTMSGVYGGKGKIDDVEFDFDVSINIVESQEDVSRANATITVSNKDVTVLESADQCVYSKAQKKLAGVIDSKNKLDLGSIICVGRGKELKKITCSFSRIDREKVAVTLEKIED